MQVEIIFDDNHEKKISATLKSVKIKPNKYRFFEFIKNDILIKDFFKLDFPKIITTLSFLSIILGVIVSVNYLTQINHPQIIVEVLSDINSLMAIILIELKFLLILLSHFFILFLIYRLFSNKFCIKKIGITLFILFLFTLVRKFFFKISSDDYYDIFPLFDIALWKHLIFLIILPFVGYLWVNYLLKNEKESIMIKSFFSLFLSYLVLMISSVLKIHTYTADRAILYDARIAEKIDNSSWYLIHNGNTASETINGMTKDEIEKYKSNFIPNNWAKICKIDDFNRRNVDNCRVLYDYIQDMNPNALYGYFAWNLGNTKVFCPQSVDFFKTDNQNERNTMSQRCLVIDGKYLQLISNYYIEY